MGKLITIRTILEASSFVFICLCLVSTTANIARCFQFTWLGPRYNNNSVIANATCDDATQMAQGIPCRLPLVASYDGSWPDVDYIWTNYGEHASCILAENDVCAKYTYYFDGVAENSTHMCTRAVDVLGGPAITSGCYQQQNGSFGVRVCLCRSVPGGMPCNDANLIIVTPILITALAILIVNINHMF